MSITYGIVEEVYTIGTAVRTAYGIAAYANEQKTNNDTIIASVHDVTADREAMTAFVALCNRLSLSTIHLHDAIADFLAF